MGSGVTDWGKRASRTPSKLDVNAGPSLADCLMFCILLVFSSLYFCVFRGVFGIFFGSYATGSGWSCYRISTVYIYQCFLKENVIPGRDLTSLILESRFSLIHSTR